MSSVGKIIFLHLSDIHFSGRDRSSPYELDEQLRSELENHVVEVAKELGGITAIVISGDIAFSGSKSQYAIARAWLTELTAKLNIPPESVWMVPGNHDIDRSRQQDALSRAIRNDLRTTALTELDSTIERMLGEDASASLLFAPFENYVEFANTYECATTPEKCAWTVPFDLGSGYRLHLTGVNSSLVSDATDDRTPANKRLVVGAFQTSHLLRRAGIVHMTVCHHPPSWIRDSAQLEPTLANNVALRLTGHEHQFGVRKQGFSVCVEAGAAHPERQRKDWEPRYNVIAIELDATSHVLSVTIYPCVWDANRARFTKGDGWGQCLRDSLDSVIRIEGAITEEEEVPVNLNTSPVDDLERSVKKVKSPERHLAYRIAGLRSLERRVVALKVGMTETSFALLGPDEFVRSIIRLAEETRKLDMLWHEVELAHGIEEPADNPYS
jgi:predicted phosphodiesterase